MSRLVPALALGLAAALPTLGAARAEPVTVIDVAGREVTVEKNPQKVVLGEGRVLYGTAVLDREDPFGRLAGWADDMILYDPGTYRKFAAKFPEAETLPRFSSAYNGEFSVEQAISLDADLVIFTLSAFYRVRENGILDSLEKAGIPSLVVDFRESPLENTVPSMTALGRVLGKETVAREFNDFYLKETRKVFVRVNAIKDKDRVHVIMERAAGYDPNKCCNTFGDANLGAMLEAAGGINWGSSRFAGVGGQINPETIFAEDPPIIIGTGADWSEAVPASLGVPFGYEATPERAQAALKALADRPGWRSLRAVKSGQFYSVYHQFYISPAHVVPLQLFAKWMYPDLFADLDPEAVMREYHERFFPLPYTGVFWARLNG